MTSTTRTGGRVTGTGETRTGRGSAMRRHAMRHRIQRLRARGSRAGYLLLVAAGLAVTPAAAAQPTGSTLVVDRDRAQCGSAAFTSIQAAVDAALPGDLVRV